MPGFAVDFTEDARHFGRPRAPPTPTQPVKADTGSDSSDSTSATAASASAPASAPAPASSSATALDSAPPRALNGMMHISDWLPTFLALAGVDANAVAALQLDGVNQACGVTEESITAPIRAMIRIIFIVYVDHTQSFWV